MLYAVYYKGVKKMLQATWDRNIVEADLKRLSGLFMHLTIKEVVPK